MTEPIIIEVNLDPVGKPPAADSLRQLLSLVDALPNGGGTLDWRLVSVSLNSPLRAAVRAFDPAGVEVGSDEVDRAVSAAFDVLNVTNDNDPVGASQALSPTDQKKLRSLLVNLKGTNGNFTIKLPNSDAQIYRAQQAERVLSVLSSPPKLRGEEYGSVEGEIVGVTRYFGKPALKIKHGLTGEVITCVFSPEIAQEIGVEHTLDEVWGARRVSVGGLIRFGSDRRPATIEADRLRSLSDNRVSDIVARWRKSGESVGIEPSEWPSGDD